MNLTKRTLLVAAVCLLASSIPGCDPGYDYKPVDADGKKSPEWSTTISGVRFSTGLGILLIGSTSAEMWVEVANESKEEVEVIGAALETKGQTMDIKLKPEYREKRSVTADSIKQFTFSVDLGGQASDVLGPTITLVWRVRIGTVEHTLRVRLDR